MGGTFVMQCGTQGILCRRSVLLGRLRARGSLARFAEAPFPHGHRVPIPPPRQRKRRIPR